MSELKPINGFEKEENRLGKLSERQRYIILSRYRRGMIFLVCPLLVSIISYLFLFISWQRNSIESFLSLSIVYGPGIIIISARYARKNWMILHKGKVEKEIGLIQKHKKRRVLRGGELYINWLMVNKTRIPINANDFLQIEEQTGTVYYLTVQNTQREILFIDSLENDRTFSNPKI